MTESKTTKYKMFYVRAIDVQGGSMATGIQINIPEGMDKEQAKLFAFKEITQSLFSYFLGECIQEEPCQTH